MKADFEKGTKVCSRCKRELPISEFGKQSGKSDGLTLYCAECRREIGKLKREAVKNDPVRHAKMLEAYKRYHQSEKGREKAREQEKRRRDSPEKLKKLAEKQRKYYQEKLAHPRSPREFIINEEGKECLKCCDCGRILPKEFFYRESVNPLGYAYKCKDCKYEQSSAYYQTDKYKQYTREYNKTYRQKESYKKMMNEWSAKKRQTDPAYKMSVALSNSFIKWIKGTGEGTSILKYIECSRTDFIEWIEMQFAPGMTWENHGFGNGKWHLDHILPKSRFNHSNEYHRMVCWHYSNFRPLWGEDNILKKESLIDGWGDFLESIKEEVGIPNENIELAGVTKNDLKRYHKS